MTRRDIENAKIALIHRLYSQPTYLLIEELRSIAAGHKSKCILHYIEGIPVGVCVRNPNGRLQVFVRKSHRKKGIGSLLVNKLKTKNSHGSPDSISNGKIFKYNGVRVQG